MPTADLQNRSFYTNEQGLCYTDQQGDNHLVAEAIATLPGFQTPCYVYHLEHLKNRCRFLKNTFQQALGPRYTIHYAVKANHNLTLLQVIRAEGLYVDVVSGGEVSAALAAGFNENQILFSGVGKTRQELRSAMLRRPIRQINVESQQELERIFEVLLERGQTGSAPIDIGLRLNPDVCPETHPYITTGLTENKFGLGKTEVREALKSLELFAQTHPKIAIRFRGLSIHIGSQLLELSSVDEALKRTVELHLSLAGEFSNREVFCFDRFDGGGGIGINYTTDDEELEKESAAAWAGLLKKHLRAGPLIMFQNSLNLPTEPIEVMVEPGRWLVARCGALIVETQYTKSNSHKNFVIVDGGMNFLLRPALYQAEHRIAPLLKRNGEMQVVDVVGPICESADALARQRSLPPIQQGDRLAILDSGAYGASMASHYNLREWPVPEFFLPTHLG